MKIITTLFLVIYFHLNLLSQKEIKTYYDPFQKTKLKEKYYVDGKNQKQGKYIKYDDRGLRGLEINYMNGKPHGIAFEYSLPLIGYPGDEKVKKVANYVNGVQQGKTSYYVYLKDGAENIKEGKKTLQGEEFYENDIKVREISYFLNGKKEVDAFLQNGVQKKWYDNGQLAIELHVVDGVYNGSWKEWYTNGQIGIISTRKDGKLFGEKKEYYVNGKIKSIENYALGDHYGEIFKGTQQYFDSTGILTKEYNFFPFENGRQKKKVIHFYSDGSKKSEFTEILLNRGNKDTKITGVYVEFFPNGKKAVEGSFNDNGYRHGIWKYYEFDSEDVREGKFYDGYRSGKWKIYYNYEGIEVNTLIDASYFREIIFTDNGELTNNLVTDYYKNGSKKFEGYLIEIEPDVINGETKFYYENGNLKSYGFMKNNVKNGRWKDYYENGKIKLEYELKEHYNKEQKNGVWSYFDVNEKLERVEIYRDNYLVESKTGHEMYAIQAQNKQKHLIQLLKEQKDEMTLLFTKKVQLENYSYEKTIKKELFKAFIKLNEYYNEQLTSNSDFNELNKIEIKIKRLTTKMNELINKDTKDLEKKIKKSKSASQIEDLLGINL